MDGFSKVSGYKINIQKLVAFCIILMKYQKRNVKKKKKKNLFQNCTKRIKISRNKPDQRGERLNMLITIKH